MNMPMGSQRARASLSVFLVFAFVFTSLFTGFWPVPSATAYVDQEITTPPPGTGTGAGLGSVTASLTHSKIDDQGTQRDARPGETFNYIGSVDFEFRQSGTFSGQIVITQDPNAPFTDPAVTFPPEYSGVQLSGPRRDGNNLIYEFSNLSVTVPSGGSKTVTARVESHSTVNPDANPGSAIRSSLKGEIFASIDPVSQFTTAQKLLPTNPLSCYRVAQFTATVNQNSPGIYLMDIKYAKPVNGVNAVLDPLPDKAAITVDPNNKLLVKSANGADITQKAIDAGLEVRKNDTSAPLYATDPKILNSNARFVDSLNWPYDPSTYLGKLWLNPGDTVTVTRGFTLNNCVAGVATNYDINRNPAIAVQFDMARPATPITGFASDYLVIPGNFVTTPWCENIYLNDVEEASRVRNPTANIVNAEQKYYTPQDHNPPISLFNPNVPGDSGWKLKSGSKTQARAFTGHTLNGTIAATIKHEGYLYYLTGNPKLQPADVLGFSETVCDKIVLDGASKPFGYTDASCDKNRRGRLRRTNIETNEVKDVEITNPSDLQNTRINIGAMTSDKDGNLWVQTGLTADTWGLGKFTFTDNSGLKAKFTAFPGTIYTGSKTAKLYDLTFDANNYIQISYGDPSTRTIVVDSYNTAVIETQGLSSDDFTKYGADKKLVGIYQYPLTDKAGNRLSGDLHGVAWGPDGNLYVSIGKNTSTDGPVFFNRSIFKLEPVPAGSPTGRSLSSPASLADKEVAYSPAAVNGIRDMASCAFGPSDNIAFDLTKQAVDPQTGELVTAGGVAQNPVVMSGNTATVQYVVIHRAGNKGGDPGLIQDQFYAPKGFRVDSISARMDGADLPLSNLSSLSSRPVQFNYRVGTLAPNEGKAVEVTVKLTRTNPSEPLPSLDKQCVPVSNDPQDDSHCNPPRDSGGYDTGFFNRVRAKDQSFAMICGNDQNTISDSSGIRNNDGCIKVTEKPKAHLKLVKKILDSAGNDVTSSRAWDLNKFTLTATRYAANETLNGGTHLSGIPSQLLSKIGVAVDADVDAGTYRLDETLAKDPVTAYYRAGKYTCIDALGQQVSVSDQGAVELAEGDNVTCTIKNTQIGVFKVVKQALDPTAQAGAHEGKIVELTPDGRGDYTGSLKYKIIVSNLSPFSGTSGEIRDRYKLPAGLLLNGDITVQAGPGGTFDGLVTKPQYSGLASTDGALLANSVTLPGNGSVTLTVTVPVKADLQAKGDTTAFHENRDDLATCELESVGNEGVVVHSDKLKGSVNGVYLHDEDPNYAPTDRLWFRDNFACIPVKVTFDTDILVHKVDNMGALSLPDAEFKICDQNPYTEGPDSCKEPLPTLKLDNCGIYPADSNARAACVAHYGAAATGGTEAEGSVFVAQNLKPGTEYWLVETRAPACFSPQVGEEYCAALLPEPLKFSVDEEGVITAYDANGEPVQATGAECDPSIDSSCKETNAYKLVGSSYGVFKNVISVRDPRNARLPVSGGAGPLPLVLAAAILLLVSGGYALKTSAVATRPVTARKPR